MFVNRSLTPNHRVGSNHQQNLVDWFDPTNHLLNKKLSKLALLDEEILSRISRKGGIEDQLYLLGSKKQHQVNWNDPKKFEMKLDVTSFTPSEVTVKVKGNSLLVEGKHEEKQDKNGHSYVSRQFTRRYTLPDDVDLEQLSSSFDEQGKTLTIHALKKKLQLDGSELIIPITVREKKQLEGARDVVMKG